MVRPADGAREPEQQGAIQGAINHPVQWISAGYSLEDKEVPVVVYCATGMRSRMAKEMLLNSGFTQVHDLGGFHSIQAC